MNNIVVHAYVTQRCKWGLNVKSTTEKRKAMQCKRGQYVNGRSSVNEAIRSKKKGDVFESKRCEAEQPSDRLAMHMRKSYGVK